jgi:putative nucleotidyltransferase with HDIG domain
MRTNPRGVALQRDQRSCKDIMTGPHAIWIYPGFIKGIRPIQRDSTICDLAALSVALGAQDAYTRGHALRVAAYAERMAQRLGLSSENVETVRIGGLLHDIGKIAFSPSLINNTRGRLSEAMRDEIRRHPEIGGQFLKDIHVAEPVIDCVRYHHERLDGSGYPFGLSAADIPMGARIVSVADCFDALTTDRSYQRGRAAAEAVDILRGLGAEYLSPELVAELIAEVRENGLQP